MSAVSILDELDTLSEEASQRYRGFTMSLVGLLTAALNDPNPTAPKTRIRYDEKARELASTFLSNERQLCALNTARIVHRALRDASLKEAMATEDMVRLSEAEDFIVGQFGDALVAQIQRDIGVPRSIIMRLAIETAMLARQRGWDARRAGMSMRTQWLGKAPEFRFMDRAGRQWASTGYVRNLARGHYLNAYNETFMFALSTAGINVVRAIHPDRPDGQPIAIVDAGDETLPTYAEVKAELFHPNSRVIVTRVISQR